MTGKQERFKAEYLVDLNATKAAIRAGYSEKTAYSQGQRLLKNVEIAAAIMRGKEKQITRIEITADRVLQEIAKLGFVDPRKFFRADGSPKDITELDDDTAAALAGIEVLEQFEGSGDDRKFVGYIKKFKLADKGQNLERLGKHLSLFTDRHELTGKDGEPLTGLTVSFVEANGS